MILGIIVTDGSCRQAGRDPGSHTHSMSHSLTLALQKCRSRSNILPNPVSDTAPTNHDGSSLEFVSATVVKECYIQDARCKGLCGVGHVNNRPFID